MNYGATEWNSEWVHPSFAKLRAALIPSFSPRAGEGSRIQSPSPVLGEGEGKGGKLGCTHSDYPQRLLLEAKGLK